MRAGTGHVVVTATEPGAAARLVEAALERSSALAVLRVRAASANPFGPPQVTSTESQGATSARDEAIPHSRGAASTDSRGAASADSRGAASTDSRDAASADSRDALDGLLAQARATERNIFALVEDADAVTAEELERLRMAVECIPDAIGRLRMVLVGTPRLELTLTEPAAGALVSRVGTHVRLPAGASKALWRRLSGLRGAATSAMTLAASALFRRTQAARNRHHVGDMPAAREGVVAAEKVADASASAQPATKSASASASASRSTTASAAPRESARRKTERAVTHTPTPRASSAEPASSPTPERKGRHATHAPLAARASARVKTPLAIEAATFKDAAAADALREQLASRIAQVQVTRVDTTRGPRYSVRVLGAETPRAIAHVEREIRALGHRPVRITSR